MKLISLLIALLIIGGLIYKQLGNSASKQEQEIQALSESVDAPKVPTKPQDVNKFDSQMNDFMNQENKKRSEAIDNAAR